MKLRCEVHNHGALTYSYVTSKLTVVTLDMSIDCRSKLVDTLANRPPARSGPASRDFRSVVASGWGGLPGKGGPRRLPRRSNAVGGGSLARSKPCPYCQRCRIKQGPASAGLAGPETQVMYAPGKPGTCGLTETAYNVPDIENCRCRR